MKYIFGSKYKKIVIDIEYEYTIFNDGKDWPDSTNFGDISEGKEGIIQKCNELNIRPVVISNQHLLNLFH